MRFASIVALFALAFAGCGDSGPAEAHLVASQAGSGIALRVTLSGSQNGLVVETRVQNRRPRPLRLVQDRCGRVGTAELARTTRALPGRTWPASVQAVKRLVLREQGSAGESEPLSSAGRPCASSRRTLTLAPGAVLHARWVARTSPLLNEVGSTHAVVRVRVAEAGAAGRSVALERPVAAVIRWPIRAPTAGPVAQQFDQLLANAELRRLLSAQPSASWRSARLTVFGNVLRFSAVSSRYDRAFSATARADGSEAQVTAPGPRDRTGPYPTAPAELPDGIRVIAEPKGFVATHDVLPGRLSLPTGRVAADSYFTGDTKPLADRATPGDDPVRITLARSVGRDPGENVALATLVVSAHPTVRWHSAGTIGVDGGTAAFSSAEGAATLGDLAARDERAWNAWNDAATDALTAHRFVAAKVPIGPGTNAIEFSTGLGDGGYGLYVGLDASGRATRFVLDGGLLHLAWPAERDSR